MGTIRSGSKIITTAGTPERITATWTRVQWAIFQAGSGNTGDAVVGDANIAAADASAGDRVGAYVAKGDATAHVRLDGPFNLQDVYADVANSGDAVHFAYLELET